MLLNQRYQLLEKLGQGGMGIVYRAYDRLTGKIIALKQVIVSDFEGSRPESSSDNFRLALTREFRVLASLRHPNIVSVLDYGFDSHARPYFTMSYLEAPQNVVGYASTLPEQAKIALLVQILEALHYLHQHGILHRDLKPDNVLVNQEATVKILDFGLAISDKQSQQPENEHLSGTLAYMAPELFANQTQSVQSDLYAFGLLAYEIFLGRPAFAAKNIGILILKITTENPDYSPLPEALQVWFAHLLDKDPEQRPRSAYESLEALCQATNLQMPPESQAIREGFLQSANFVGRESELAQLTTALETVKQGSSQFFLVAGESGVGKSRLLEELRTQAVVDGFVVLRGQGVSDKGLPFQLWRQALRNLALILPVSDFQAAVLQDIVPDIETLLNRPIPAIPRIDGQAYQQRITFTLLELFKQIQQPTLFLMEDLHWAWESLHPLRQILKLAEEIPYLMLVGTYRNDERPDLPKELPGMQLIKLGRLNTTSIAYISASILGSKGHSPELHEFLARESEGNTFFMLEIIRSLASNLDRLQKLDIQKLPEQILTGGMREILSKRLQQMPTQYQTLLHLAAVIGREIDEKLVTFIHGKEPGNFLYHGELTAIFVLQDNQWQFAHEKLRSLILEELAPTMRQSLHEQVASAIEKLYPQNADYDEVLLEHWHQAANLDKEIHYLRLVAEPMIRIKALYAQARDLLTRGLAALPANDARRVVLLNLEAESYQAQGNFEKAASIAQAALEQAEAVHEQHGAATSLNLLGLANRDQGNYQAALNYHQRSLEIRREIQDQVGIAVCLNSLGIVSHYLNQHEQAMAYYQESLSWRYALDDKRGISICLNNLGDLAFYQGNYLEADKLLKESLAIRRQLGDKIGLVIGLNGLGLVDLKMKKGQAAQYFWEGLQIAQSIQATSQIVMMLTCFIGVYLQKGDFTRSAELVGLVDAHPAKDANVRKLLEDLLPELEAGLEPAILKAAMARGKELDLSLAVQELLDEFAPVPG